MSILLCLVMVFTCVTPVFADTAATWTAEDFTYGEEEMKVYVGDSKEFSVDAWVVKGLSTAGQEKFAAGNTDIVIPAKDPNGKKVQGVGANAFKGTSSSKPFGITSVVFPETEPVAYGNTTRGDFFIGNAAFRYNNLTALELPEGVVLLDLQCFANNKLLTSVKMPKSMMSIYQGAFNSCGLTSVDFPDQTNLALQIDTMAFPSSKLVSVQLPSNIEKLHQWSFRKTGTKVNIYIDVADKNGLGSYVSTDTSYQMLVYGKDPAKVSFMGDKATLEYTEVTFEAGKTYEPAVTIEGLVKDTDFTVTYENNAAVGTAKAVVKGTGSYYGELELEFAIKSAPAPTPTVPVTGDTAPMALMVALMAVAAAGGLVAYRKRNN